MISIITVNYNSRNYLEKLITSINKYFDTKKIELIIVNNDEQRLAIENRSFPIKIIQNKTNTGFGSACNIAAQKAKNDWLLFINPDVEFIDNSFREALDYSTKNSEKAIIGAKIIESSNNLIQPWTCGKKMTLFSVLFKNTLMKPWNRNIPTGVDWVSGTAMLVSKNNFEKLGGFDESFFMYFEDQDFCLRAKKAGLKVVFHPDFKVIHHNGKSWEKNRKKQKQEYYKSQEKFFQKHNSFFDFWALRFFRKIFKGY